MIITYLPWRISLLIPVAVVLIPRFAVGLLLGVIRLRLVARGSSVCSLLLVVVVILGCRVHSEHHHKGDGRAKQPHHDPDFASEKKRTIKYNDHIMNSSRPDS